MSIVKTMVFKSPSSLFSETLIDIVVQKNHCIPYRKNIFIYEYNNSFVTVFSTDIVCIRFDTFGKITIEYLYLFQELGIYLTK